MVFTMSLVDLAVLLASFSTVLAAIAGLVTWALSLIIGRKIAEMQTGLEARLAELEVEHDQRLIQYMRVASCEKIRDEQATHLRVIVRDELNTWWARQIHTGTSAPGTRGS